MYLLKHNEKLIKFKNIILKNKFLFFSLCFTKGMFYQGYVLPRVCFTKGMFYQGYVYQGYPWIPLINFSQFGPAVWPANSYYIYIQAWKPSAAQITKSYFLRLPAFERFYRETEFSLIKVIKVDPLNLESQNQEHFRVSPEIPNRNLRQIGFPVLWSDNQTENRDYNFIYIDIFIWAKSFII